MSSQRTRMKEGKKRSDFGLLCRELFEHIVKILKIFGILDFVANFPAHLIVAFKNHTYSWVKCSKIEKISSARAKEIKRKYWGRDQRNFNFKNKFFSDNHLCITLILFSIILNYFEFFYFIYLLIYYICWIVKLYFIFF